jgi:hypothetical protein
MLSRHTNPKRSPFILEYDYKIKDFSLKKVSDYAHILCGAEVLEREREDACAAEIATKPSKEPPSIMQITADNLARNLCQKYDHNCGKCPVGLMNNGRGLPCDEFRRAYTEEAIQIMRKVGE